MQQHIPARIDVNRRTVMGVGYREITIVVVGLLVAALFAFILLARLPIFVRGAVGVLIAGLGVAGAFGRIEDRTPELWFADLISFRRNPRVFVHRAGQASPEPQVTLPAETETTAPSPPSWPTQPEVVAAPPRNDFIQFSINALGLSLLTALTLWLLDGGAYRLSQIWSHWAGGF